MKTIIKNEKGEVIQTYTVRSDHAYHEEYMKIIELWIDRYVQPEKKYQIIIDNNTLWNDPNTEEGRKRLLTEGETGRCCL